MEASVLPFSPFRGHLPVLEWLVWAVPVTVAVAAGVLLYHVRAIRRLGFRHMERVRTQIASDLHDDVGSALTRLVVQSEMLCATEDPGRMKAIAREIGNEARDVISTMSDVVWSIDARNDSVRDLMDRMRDFSAGVLEGCNVAVHFREEGLEPERRLPVRVRQNLYLIFKEAVSNIARHSVSREVWIDIAKEGDGLRLAVRSDGLEMAGHSLVHAHGQGQRNMRMRAEQIGATVDILHDRGIAVVLRLPCLWGPKTGASVTA